MAEQITRYLAALEKDLEGRLPAAEVRAILDESASHLYELREELGTDERAVAKFGSPRRCARRILNAASVPPNPWRAAILPLSLFSLFIFATSLAPMSFQWRLFGEVFPGYSWMDLLEDGMAVSLLVLFARSRQILVKPLIALGTVCFVVYGCVLASYGARISVPGGDMVLPNGPKGIAELNESLTRDLAQWEGTRSLLEKGMVVFQDGVNPKAVPSELLYHGGPFLNPATLTGDLACQDDAKNWLKNLRPFQFHTSFAYGGADSAIEHAVASWKRDGKAAEARVDQQIEMDRAVMAAAPAAQGESYPMVFLSHAPVALRYGFRSAYLLFTLNLAGWLLWKIYRSFVLPRRRYA